jgi:hypothetical protein
MDEEDEGDEIIFCRYGQCADRQPQCPSCIVLPADAEEETIEAAIAATLAHAL